MGMMNQSGVKCGSNESECEKKVKESVGIITINVIR